MKKNLFKLSMTLSLFLLLPSGVVYAASGIAQETSQEEIIKKGAEKAKKERQSGIQEFQKQSQGK